jgi:uncharacterized protein (TIGR03083 family)
MGLGDGYLDGQRRMSTLVEALDEDQLDRHVPLNPAWRVRDVVAHSVGLCEDSLSRNYPDFTNPKAEPDQARAREAWTQAQVVRWGNRPMSQLLERWSAFTSELASLLDAEPPPADLPASIRTGAPFDVGCHLHDLRHALEQPGDRDAPTTRLAFAIGRAWLGLRLRSADLPALRLRTRDREWVLGEASPAATVAGDDFELFRAVTGRRSLAQVLALDWDGDPMSYVDVLSPYPFPEQDVME